MLRSKTSVKISIGVCIAVAVVLLVFVVFGSRIFDLYMVAYRGFTPDGEALENIKKVFGCCFYPCAVLATVILYSLLRLLFNIKNENIFIIKNANYLKAISYCLLLVGIITFAGGFFYMPFMFVSIAAFFTGILMRALKNVFQSAIELREENDLTV